MRSAIVSTSISHTGLTLDGELGQPQTNYSRTQINLTPAATKTPAGLDAPGVAAGDYSKEEMKMVSRRDRDKYMAEEGRREERERVSRRKSTKSEPTELDKLRAGIQRIITDHVGISGPTLDYLQGYRDGEDCLKDQLRELLK